MINRARVISVFVLVATLFYGCSEDDPAPASEMDMTVDMGDATDSGRNDLTPEVDVGPDQEEPVEKDEWGLVDSCLIDYALGPIVIFAESSSPPACIRVVLDQNTETSSYEIEDDLTYKTSEVRLSATLCDSQILVDTSAGVSATTATGTVNVVVTDLSQPLEVEAIDLEIQFAEDDANPFGPLNARFSLPNKVYEIGPAFECGNLE
jgi:hypothetical protein